MTSRRATMAAVVGLLGALIFVAGAGHVYLRRWRRAAVWFVGGVAGLVALSLAFADPAVESLAALPPEVTAPYFLFLSLSVADAYLVASGTTATTDLPGPLGGDESGEAGGTSDSSGRTTDPGLRFCWYCAASLPESVDRE
jgi:hypothetical protein